MTGMTWLAPAYLAFLLLLGRSLARLQFLARRLKRQRAHLESLGAEPEA